MSLFDLLRGKSKPTKEDEEIRLIEILKNAPTASLSMLNRKVELFPGLTLPVAEALESIDKIHEAIQTVSLDYPKLITKTNQWSELYKAGLSYLMVCGLNDKILQERYWKLTFKPTVNKILGIETINATSIGPRKSMKVKHLDFANRYYSYIGKTNNSNNILNAPRLLDIYASLKNL
jgi:hypothetical protein